MNDAAGDSEAARLRAILIGSAGNLVEWCDFYIYATCSLYFADAFFPGGDPLAQMMSAGRLRARLSHAKPPFDLAQLQHAAVGRHRAVLECGDDFPSEAVTDRKAARQARS